jgi:hypothetical protein
MLKGFKEVQRDLAKEGILMGVQALPGVSGVCMTGHGMKEVYLARYVT